MSQNCLGRSFDAGGVAKERNGNHSIASDAWGSKHSNILTVLAQVVNHFAETRLRGKMGVTQDVDLILGCMVADALNLLD